ncbi:MAG: 4-hydroxymandelate synthase [Micromonosporaceae bacterium]
MDIHGFDHIELYVGDANATAFLLCTAFGFRVAGASGPETGLTGQRSLLLRQGGVNLILTSALSGTHPAARYVSRHGDGVAVIAFATGDAEQAYARAVAQGAAAVSPPLTYADGQAEVATATVSGFGDVVHRLVTRRGAAGRFLPGVMEMTDTGPDDGVLSTVDHVAVCLPGGELAETVHRYREVFGFSEIFDEYIDVGGQGMISKVVQSESRGVTFTLIEPDVTRRPGQIDDFLSWHGGAGVQHVAFGTGDIVHAVRTLTGQGVAFASTPGSYYDGLASRVGELERPLSDLRELGVLVDQDRWGRMYQIFTRSMHVRRTLFFELIERHGALTFGSSNIRALYEAKERELQRAQVRS